MGAYLRGEPQQRYIYLMFSYFNQMYLNNKSQCYSQTRKKYTKYKYNHDLHTIKTNKPYMHIIKFIFNQVCLNNISQCYSQTRKKYTKYKYNHDLLPIKTNKPYTHIIKFIFNQVCLNNKSQCYSQTRKKYTKYKYITYSLRGLFFFNRSTLSWGLHNDSQSLTSFTDTLRLQFCTETLPCWIHTINLH